MQPPPLVARALADTDTPFRVDGFRGLTDNYGSLYGLADMRGISPLFLDGPFQLIEPEKHNPTAWELFAVRYVYSDWEQLPAASTIIAQGDDRYGPVNLHQLDDPRPFAHLVYSADVVDSATAILHAPLGLDLPGAAPTSASADVVAFAPEAFTVHVSTPDNAILTLAHPDYPGWQAQVDGAPVPILRAYGGLSAVALPAGDHTVTFTYTPRAFAVGAALSLVTWAALGILAAALVFGRGRRPRVQQ
jgi:hypothetical protein